MIGNIKVTGTGDYRSVRVVESLSHAEFQSSVKGIRVAVGNADSLVGVELEIFAEVDVWGVSPDGKRYHLTTDGTYIGTRLRDESGKVVEWKTIDWWQEAGQEARIEFEPLRRED